MKNPLMALLATGIAGMGGALAVFGSYDDSPGGTLLGIVLVLAAMAFNTKHAQPMPSRATRPEES